MREIRLNKRVKRAATEATSDTILGTFINFPFNFAIIWVCLSLNFNALQTTIACTVIMFFLAVIRKTAVRLWFEKKYDARANTRTVEQGRSSR